MKSLARSIASNAGPEISSSEPLPSGPRLNLGCGPVQPAGWINIDGSRRARLAAGTPWLDRALVSLRLLPPTDFGPQVHVADLLKPLPFADASVACIYAGEVWEHFELADAERLTRECLRVLAPGGVLRLCVPDGAEFWGRYLKLYEEEMAKPPAHRTPSRLRDHLALFFNDIATRRVWLGSMGHFHKWQFDEVQLVALLQDAGFCDVARRRWRDSDIPGIEAVERSDFLIVEARRPTPSDGSSRRHSGAGSDHPAPGCAAVRRQPARARRLAPDPQQAFNQMTR